MTKRHRNEIAQVRVLARARRLSAAVLLAAVVIGAGPAGRSGSVTSYHFYDPFFGRGVAAAIRVADAVSGYCWPMSFAAPQSAAFRCRVGRFVYDPCFGNSTTPRIEFLLCPLRTPVSDVLRVDLTPSSGPFLPGTRPRAGGLPPRIEPQLPLLPRTGRPWPWAVKTRGGRWCVTPTRAIGAVAGMAIQYVCEGGGILIGDLDRSRPSWTIRYATTRSSRRFRRVAIAQAWW
jgi:hypothetical protein